LRPNAERHHIRLAFGCEGGGSGGSGGGNLVGWPKNINSGSRLDAREVVVVAGGRKRQETPPPARVWMRGRWWWWQAVEKGEKDHLQLAFGCEGGGGGGNGVERRQNTTSGSRLDAREVVMVTA